MEDLGGDEKRVMSTPEQISFKYSFLGASFLQKGTLYWKEKTPELLFLPPIPERYIFFFSLPRNDKRRHPRTPADLLDLDV